MLHSLYFHYSFLTIYYWEHRTEILRTTVRNESRCSPWKRDKVPGRISPRQRGRSHIFHFNTGIHHKTHLKHTHTVSGIHYININMCMKWYGVACVCTLRRSLFNQYLKIHLNMTLKNSYSNNNLSLRILRWHVITLDSF